MLKSRPINILFGLMLVFFVGYDVKYDLSPGWYVAIIIVYLTIQAYGSAVLSAEFFIRVKWRGSLQSNAVALTFDDGPVPGRTESILEVLKLYNAPAAFFCIGKKVTENDVLVRTLNNAGHLVGNHSYWHKYTFDLQSALSIQKELMDTDLAIQKAIGLKPAFFRPPYGVTNPMVAKAIRKGKYTTVGWSVRSFDTSIRNSDKLMKRITRTLKGGDIILLHDHGASTLQILPALLEHIAAVGLKIVRLDELLNEKAYV